VAVTRAGCSDEIGSCPPGTVIAHLVRIGRRLGLLAEVLQLSIEAAFRAAGGAVIVPLVIADRFAPVVGDIAGYERHDLEAILLPAFRAADVFQAVAVGHTSLPVASRMTACATLCSWK